MIPLFLISFLFQKKNNNKTNDNIRREKEEEIIIDESIKFQIEIEIKN
jgi:hypothetical protein